MAGRTARAPEPVEPVEPVRARDDGRYSNGGYNAGIAVFSYIVGGILVWSLIGWGLDYVLDTRFLVLLGAFLGAAGGFYLSHMHNLIRHHSDDPPSGSGTASGSGTGTT
ncbi:hypothetical protein E8P82_09345 [Arthrobacter echini]|uniref:AtpZ/AtpI family protein n=1 Tax=Arthrobacter echini TaxID=1529066 RepID=A0A4V3Z5E2_9MICC|nr:hypothetical protein [Arthrobacter echini]THJ66199.1 hypothetical protein E8P82_09345 [Arthrobacter echini]